MKKVFGQTVRDIKRGVNKKVLKVPGIEQKVLDATSNETWGPHGTLLSDIAQATRNYHEYQMIMSILWKRISDTGKNWRHVFKALTVLEYLVAHGSDRVIDEIREHAYQISALSGFQYIDSGGRDQGSNVRKKSQSLVALVNDKEMITEVRQKAVANREKFRTSSTSGMYRPGSYDDDRYGSRDDDRNGYGREREWGSRDDDRNSRNGDSYGQDGDRNNRNGDSYGQDGDRNGRDGYKDDYRARSRDSDEDRHGSRSRSSDRDRDRAYDDDGQYSSRKSAAQAGDQSQNEGEHGQKFSEQNIGAPPSYEAALSNSRSPVQSERDGENAPPATARASPHVSNNPTQEAATSSSNNDASSLTQGIEPSDEFDPRGSVATPFSAETATSSFVEMDLLGSLADTSFSNPLAIMPATPATTSSETSAHANFGSGPTYAATPSAFDVTNQAYENPFGDAPFKAIHSTGSEPQPQPSVFAAQVNPAVNHNAEQPKLGTPTAKAGTDFGFGDSFSALSYPVSSSPNVQTPTNSQLAQERSSSQQDFDILADILPPSEPQPVIASETPFSASAGHFEHPNPNYYGGFPSQTSSVPTVTQNMVPHTQIQATHGSMAIPPQNHLVVGVQLGSGNMHSMGGSVAPPYPTGSAAQFSGGNFLQQQDSHVGSQSALLTINGTGAQYNNGNFLAQQGSQVGSQPSLQTMSGTAAQFNGGNFLQQQGSQPALYNMNGTPAQFSGGNSLQQQGSQLGPQSSLQTVNGSAAQHNNHKLGNLHSQPGPKTQMASQPMFPSSTGSLSTVAQPSRDKFETKSTVWADTLSRGLVDLNISGSKTNPLADIGVDFEAINRKEKRREKPATTTQVTSTVTMGKAMGSGSGTGRAGANSLRPASNPMMGPGMGMGGGYGGMPHHMGGMGMNTGMHQGMGMNPGMNPGMGMNPVMNPGMGMMNMRMGQGGLMQPPNGIPSGSAMPGAYNHMMGHGGYTQQPYGGGYR